MELLRLSRLAAARAVHPDVRAFARVLAQTQAASSSALARLAAAKEVVLSMDDTPHLTRWLDRKPAEFDRDYLDETIGILEDAVALLQDRSHEPHDPDIARFAREALPRTEEQLRHAEELLRRFD